MTTTLISNLIASLFIVAALAATCRLGFRAAGSSTSHAQKSVRPCRRSPSGWPRKGSDGGRSWRRVCFPCVRSSTTSLSDWSPLVFTCTSSGPVSVMFGRLADVRVGASRLLSGSEKGEDGEHAPV